MHGGAREGSGRKKGQLSPLRKEIKEKAQKYGLDLIDTAYEMAKNPETHDNVRFQVIKFIIEHGFGRAIQTVSVEADEEVDQPTRIVIVGGNTISRVDNNEICN